MRVQNPTVTALPPRDPPSLQPYDSGTGYPVRPRQNPRARLHLFLPLSSAIRVITVSLQPPEWTSRPWASPRASMPHQWDPIVSASDSQHSVFMDFFHPLLPLQSVLHASARTLSRVLFLLKMPNVFSKALCLVVTHLRCIQQAPGAEDALSKCYA